MLFTWENIGAHVLHMQDNANWILYADFEYEESRLCLMVEDQTYEVANVWEYLQGREHMSLDSYDVLEFYNATVIQVAKMVNEGNVRIIDLETVKEELLRTYWWPKWRKEKRVTDDFWIREDTGSLDPVDAEGTVR